MGGLHDSDLRHQWPSHGVHDLLLCERELHYDMQPVRYVILLFAALALPSYADDWTREDTYRQSALTALLIADWAQSRYIAKTPNLGYETNHVLKDHPSVGRVDNYFIVATIGHAAISYVLPPTWRQGWQYFWIGVEVQKTVHNYNLGVKFSF